MPDRTGMALREGQTMVSFDETADPPQTKEEKDKRAKVEKLLQRARKQFDTVVAAEAKLRVDQLEDKRFAASDQWPDTAKRDRDIDNRPWMTINRLPQFIRQVTNAQRQADLAVKVLPVEGADIKTAEVFQGLIRNIEDKSDASIAYSTAGDNQAEIGRGFIRVTTEFTHERSFTQELRIKRVRNPFAVYLDPSAQELDASDARYCFIVRDMPKDEYIAKYGDDAFASLTEFTSTGDMAEDDWMPEGKVRIAEWWYIDETPVEIVAIQWPDLVTPDGQTIRGARDVVTKEEFDQFPPHIKDGGPLTDDMGKTSIVKPVQVLGTRTARERKVKVAVIDKVKILEGNDDKSEGMLWPGRWIPIIPVVGVETDINGVMDYRGMVRDAIDPQRVYNYEVTSLVETLALAPIAQWVGYAGQFEGHEQKWILANRRRFPYLEVNPTTVDGQIAPLPNRIVSEPPIAGIVQAIAQMDNDLKATMGLWDPSLGQRGPQQSGKAITALQKQGEMANSNFLDNLARAIRAVGRILVDLIPHYYDAPRVERIMGKDESEKNVIVHGGADPSQLPAQPPEGIEGIYDLSAGRFDVSITVGPSLQTKRQEAAESLTEFVKVFPPAFQALGDLIVQNMDWPGAQAAASRLKKMVPAQLLEGEDGQPQIPPEVQQKMMEAEQAMQMMQAELADAKQKLAAKTVEMTARAEIAKSDHASEVQVAEIKAAADIEREKMKVQGQLIVAKFEAQIEQMQQMMEQAHERGMMGMTRDADREDTFVGHALQRSAATADRGADREDRDVDYVRGRRDQDVEYARGRQDQDIQTQREREDNLVGRVLDRGDQQRERAANREDQERERTATRQDTERERAATRQDTERERAEGRKDTEAAERRADKRTAAESKTKVQLEKIKATRKPKKT